MVSFGAHDRAARLRGGLAAAALSLLFAQGLQPAAAEPPAVSASVTKVTVARHRLAFQPNSDTPSVPLDGYLKFVESVKSADVVGVHLLYTQDPFQALGVGGPDVRRGRLLAAFRPLEGWLAERSLEASVIGLDGLNPFAPETDRNAVFVEVMSKRR